MIKIKIRHFTSLIFYRWLFDMRLAYRGSFLGVIWSLALPTFSALIYYFVFETLFHNGDVEVFDFFVYVFLGVIVVGLFANSLLIGLEVVSSNSNTLRSIDLPLTLFHIVGLLTRWFNSFVALAVLTLYGVFTRVDYGWSLLFGPVILFSVALLALPASMVICLLESSFKDTRFIVPQLTSLLIFLTPVFYLPSILPPALANILLLNPLRPYLDFLRSIYGVQSEPVNLSLLFLWLSISILATVVIASWLERRKSDIVFRV